MAYSKTTWAEDTARTLARLNNLETQYDEAIADAITLRADNSKELRVEVLASLPAAGTAGRVVFNSGNNTLYVDDGSDFRSIGASVVKAVTLYDVAFGTFGSEVDTTITAVDLGASVIRTVELGSSYTLPVADETGAIEAYFTSTTNFRIKRDATAVGSNSYQVTVIEFEPSFVKSLNSDDNVALSAGNNDITISAVTTAKTLIFLSWRAGTATRTACKASMTSTTNLRIIAPGTVTDHYASYFVVEFY